VKHDYIGHYSELALYYYCIFLLICRRLLQQHDDEEGNDSEEDLLLDEMRNAGIDEVSGAELKHQIQQYISRLMISESEDDTDSDLLAFDDILLDAIEDAKRPSSSTSSRSISEQIRLNSLKDDNEDDDHYGDDDHDDYVYSNDDDDNDDDGNKRISDSDGYDSNSSTDDDEDDDDDDDDDMVIYDDDDDMVIDDDKDADDDEVVEYNDDNDNDDDDDDDDINIDINEKSIPALTEAYVKSFKKAVDKAYAKKAKDESDGIYLTEEEWQDILARYKKPAVTELEKERERVYSLFEDYDVEKADMIEDLEKFKQMRSDEDDDVDDGDSNDEDVNYGDSNDDDVDIYGDSNDDDVDINGDSNDDDVNYGDSNDEDDDYGDSNDEDVDDEGGVDCCYNLMTDDDILVDSDDYDVEV
jgi:hypothetical protein